MYQNVKRKVYNVIRDDDENSTAGNIFDGIIIFFIIVNVVSVILDTFNMPSWYSAISSVVESVSVVLFTAEYLMRLWTSDLKYSDKSKFHARISYVISFMAIIDLLAILPFYIPFVFPIDLRILRTLRIVRLFRIFKINRYTEAFHIIGTVLKNKARQLLSSLFVVFLLMIIASVLMYSVEHEVQPEQFDNALSGLWWAIATLTTVGYGDIYPVTAIGKVLSAIIALLGIGLVAVPSGIISSGFMENIEHENEKEDEKKYCPYCGHKLDK